MNTLDIVFAIALSIGFLIGCYKGIVKQLTLGAGIVIGLLQAILFYHIAGAKLHQWTGWESLICNILGFIIIFTIVVTIFKLAGYILRWLFNLILLGTIDRVLGGLLTALITMFIIVGVTHSIGKFDENNGLFGRTSQENSLLYKPMRKFSIAFLEEVKKEVNEKRE